MIQAYEALKLQEILKIFYWPPTEVMLEKFDNQNHYDSHQEKMFYFIQQ